MPVVLTVTGCTGNVFISPGFVFNHSRSKQDEGAAIPGYLLIFSCNNNQSFKIRYVATYVDMLQVQVNYKNAYFLIYRQCCGYQAEFTSLISRDANGLMIMMMIN